MTIDKTEVALIAKAVFLINEVRVAVALNLNRELGENKWDEDEFDPRFVKKLNEEYYNLGLNDSDRLALAQILLEGKEDLYYQNENAAIEGKKEEEKDEEKYENLFHSQVILALNMDALRRLKERFVISANFPHLSIEEQKKIYDERNMIIEARNNPERIKYNKLSAKLDSLREEHQMLCDRLEKQNMGVALVERVTGSIEQRILEIEKEMNGGVVIDKKIYGDIVKQRVLICNKEQQLPTRQVREKDCVYLVEDKNNMIAHYYDGSKWTEAVKTKREFQALSLPRNQQEFTAENKDELDKIELLYDFDFVLGKSILDKVTALVDMYGEDGTSPNPCIFMTDSELEIMLTQANEYCGLDAASTKIREDLVQSNEALEVVQSDSQENLHEVDEEQLGNQTEHDPAVEVEPPLDLEVEVDPPLVPLADVLSALDKVDPNNLEDVLTFVETVLKPYLVKLHNLHKKNSKEEPNSFKLLSGRAEVESLDTVRFILLQKIHQAQTTLTAQEEQLAEIRNKKAKADGNANLKMTPEHNRITAALDNALNPLLNTCKAYKRTEAEVQLLDEQFAAIDAARTKAIDGKSSDGKVTIVSLEELVEIERNLTQDEQKEFDVFLDGFLRELYEKTEYPIYEVLAPTSISKREADETDDDYNNRCVKHKADFKARCDQEKIDYQARCAEYKKEHRNCGDFPVLLFDDSRTIEERKKAYADYLAKNKEYKRELMNEGRKQFEGSPLVVLARERQQEQHYLALINNYIDHVNKADYSEKDKREKITIAFQAKAKLTGKTIRIEVQQGGQAVEELIFKRTGEIETRPRSTGGDLEMREIDGPDDQSSPKSVSSVPLVAPAPLAQRLENFEKCIIDNKESLERNLNNTGLTILGRILQAIPKFFAGLLAGRKKDVSGEKKPLKFDFFRGESKSPALALVEAVVVKAAPAA